MFSQQVTSVRAQGTNRTQARGMPNRINRRLAAVNTGIAKSMPIGSIHGWVNPQRSAAAETELNEEASPRAPTPAPAGATVPRSALSPLLSGGGAAECWSNVLTLPSSTTAYEPP